MNGKHYSYDHDLAVKHGLAAAIIIYNIQMLQSKHEANQDASHEHEGRYYVNYTYEGLHKMFPYISLRKIRSVISELKAEGLIDVQFLAKTPWDRTPYYCFLQPIVFVTSEPIKTVTSSTYKQHETKPLEMDNGFDEFWKEYPLKKGKAPAMKKWAKMDKNCKEAALRDVCKRKASDDQWTKDGGKYIPHCSTYLNQEQWLDEWEVNTASSSVPDWML
jgi:hypothetical protein